MSSFGSAGDVIKAYAVELRQFGGHEKARLMLISLHIKYVRFTHPDAFRYFFRG
jgi:hypothetical protein